MTAAPIELLQIATGGWSPDPSVRAREVAEAQEGVIGRAQLLACGIPNGRIGRWVSRGLLLRRHPGVYAFGHGAVSARAELIAALLYGGDESALSHRTAAHARELVDSAPPAIHISVPVRRQNVPGVVVHVPRAIVASMHAGLLATTVARTLMDMAPSTPDWELRKALAEADFRKVLDAEELRAVMGRGHPGSARLRHSIERHMPELARTLSPLEDVFLLLCEREGIPLPEPNVRIGPYVVDALWENRLLIVELDGAAAHSSPDQRRRDEIRAGHLRDLGYTLLRFTWRDVVRRPSATAAAVRAALPVPTTN
jgi:REase_MTES_1575/Transcriptional regulator, AbiEi antitoxin